MSKKHISKKNFLREFVSFMIGFYLFAAIPLYVQASTLGVEVTTTTSENQSGLSGYLNRYEPTEMEDLFQVDDVGKSHYWEQYDVFNCFYEEWTDFPEGQWDNGNLMEPIDKYLHSGHGVTLKAYGYGAYDFTMEGSEYDDAGNYTGLWMANSQDTLREMTLLSGDITRDLWHLNKQNRYGSRRLVYQRSTGD